MCGRYKLDTDWTEIVRVYRLDLTEPLGFSAKYNIAPSQRVPVVHVRDGQRVARLMHWGLLSPWSTFREAARTINARAETVATSRTFAKAFRERRALVPATGFYEWRRDADRKVPHLLRPRAGHVTFAGLWQSWWDPKYEKHVDTFTIVTCPPNATIAPLHDRMPVVIPPDRHDAWLAGDADALMVPCDDDVFEVVEVSDLVNSIANEGPALAEPLR